MNGKHQKPPLRGRRHCPLLMVCLFFRLISAGPFVVLNFAPFIHPVLPVQSGYKRIKKVITSLNLWLAGRLAVGRLSDGFN
uniref:Putative secreted protein n=1 Tax=Anopheles darlingi TaxID=43151 RepID=A0A2M4DED0_ANODA